MGFSRKNSGQSVPCSDRTPDSEAGKRLRMRAQVSNLGTKERCPRGGFAWACGKRGTEL